MLADDQSDEYFRWADGFSVGFSWWNESQPAGVPDRVDCGYIDTTGACKGVPDRVDCGYIDTTGA